MEEQAIVFSRLERSQYVRQVNAWDGMEQLLSQGQERYKYFADLLADLYYGLYLYEPRLREQDELEPGHWLSREMLDHGMNLPQWEEARTLSMLNSHGAMYGLIGMAQVLMEEIPDDTEPAPEQMRRAMRRALQKGAEEMEQLSGLLAGWGVTPGEFNALPPEEAMALYGRMRKLPQLKAFADELGRMRESALEARMQPNAREAQEIVDIRTDHRPSQAIPTELGALADAETEWLFWAKVAREGLLAWEYAGKELAGKGPFVLLLDVSGSTMGPRERWCKGFAMAVLELASRDRRDVHVAFFDSKLHAIMDFPGGKADLAAKLQIAEYYTGGGTNFTPPLLYAMEAEPDADIVLVTDGECRVSDVFAKQFRDACVAKGVRIHGVVLDGRDVSGLEPICDRAFQVRSLAEDARPIFDHLVR